MKPQHLSFSEAARLGKTTYHGQVCEKHLDMHGLRTVLRRVCVGCHYERTRANHRRRAAARKAERALRA